MRDLLLGQKPKDFDVATNATPEQVKAVFSNCRLIGRRFRLAHVYFGRSIIEVATFRAAQPVQSTQHQNDKGMILRDNVYGSIEEDALRRDFSINALYYNIEDESLVDYAQGMDDIKAGLIRLLGDPITRYREDPVRMLRAARFAAKLNFTIQVETEAPIANLAYLLRDVPAARLFEEVQKLFMTGCALACFERLRYYGLFKMLFPDTDKLLNSAAQDLAFIEQGLKNTDLRIQQEKGVNPAFLFAVLLWPMAKQKYDSLRAEGWDEHPAMQQATTRLFEQQFKHVAVPRRFNVVTRDIWVLQLRLRQTQGKRTLHLLTHPSFRAAYDFLLLRTQAGEGDQKLADWWTEFQKDKTPEQLKPRGKRSGRSAKRWKTG